MKNSTDNVFIIYIYKSFSVCVRSFTLLSISCSFRFLPLPLSSCSDYKICLYNIWILLEQYNLQHALKQAFLLKEWSICDTNGDIKKTSPPIPVIPNKVMKFLRLQRKKNSFRFHCKVNKVVQRVICEIAGFVNRTIYHWRKSITAKHTDFLCFIFCLFVCLSLSFSFSISHNIVFS